MLLEEAQARLKKTAKNTEQLDAISPIYCLLGFDKDDFCKLVDTIGLDKWLDKAGRWEQLDRAERDLSAKERYVSARARLEEIETERAALEEVIKAYSKV